MKNEQYGVYNLTPIGETSWYELAVIVLNELNKSGVKIKTSSDNIKPIATEEYPLPAARPKNSKLNTDKIQKAFNLHIPNWQHYVKLILNTYRSITRLASYSEHQSIIIVTSVTFLVS